MKNGRPFFMRSLVIPAKECHPRPRSGTGIQWWHSFAAHADTMLTRRAELGNQWLRREKPGFTSICHYGTFLGNVIEE
jgi:hypothetical protein